MQRDKFKGTVYGKSNQKLCGEIFQILRICSLVSDGVKHQAEEPFEQIWSFESLSIRCILYYTAVLV